MGPIRGPSAALLSGAKRLARGKAKAFIPSQAQPPIGPMSLASKPHRKGYKKLSSELDPEKEVNLG